MGWKIVERFREQAITRFGNDFFLGSKGYGAPLPIPEGRKRTDSLPIFWEFVQYVLDLAR